MLPALLLSILYVRLAAALRVTGWTVTAAAEQAINARAILATLDMYGLGGDGDASPCNSAVPYVLEIISVSVS